MTVLRIMNGSTFAFGLQWRQLTPNGGAASIAAIIKAEGCTHAVRVGKLMACASLQTGGLSIVRSAATALTEAHGGTWLGAWDIGHGEFFVAAGGPSGIPPEGDQVFTSEAGARNHFDKLMTIGTYASLYAPDEWEIQKANPQSVFGRIQGFKGSLVLPLLFWQIAQPVPLFALAASASFLGVSVWMLPSFLKDSVPSDPLIATPPAAQTPAPTNETSSGNQQPTPINDALTRIIDRKAVEFAQALDNCLMQEAMVFDARVYGWVLTGWTCDTTRLVAHLQPRQGAPISGILSVQNREWKDPGKIGDAIDVRLPFVEPPSTPMAGVRLTREAATLQLRDLGTRLGYSITINQISATTPNEIRWVMTGVTPPEDLGLSMLRSGPSELILISHTFTGLTWRIEGVTYVEG